MRPRPAPRRARLLRFVAAVLPLVLSSCAGTTEPPKPATPARPAYVPPRVPIPEIARPPGGVISDDGIAMDSMKIYGSREDAAAPLRGEPVYDPWEPLNRRVAAFNRLFDDWALDPAAEAWDTAAPDPVQRALSNFFDNVRFPVVAGNNLLQAKPLEALSDVGRFLVNTTVGVGGFLDPAANLGLEKHDEDFGQTLAWWGAPPGPFLVLPFLGPSNVRDTTGMIVDIPMGVATFFVDTWILVAGRVADEVNERSLFTALIRRAKGTTADLYSASRGAYGLRRQALVRDEIMRPGAPRVLDLSEETERAPSPE